MNSEGSEIKDSWRGRVLIGGRTVSLSNYQTSIENEWIKIFSGHEGAFIGRGCDCAVQNGWRR